jgi:hypothetical protein
MQISFWAAAKDMQENGLRFSASPLGRIFFHCNPGIHSISGLGQSINDLDVLLAMIGYL